MEYAAIPGEATRKPKGVFSGRMEWGDAPQSLTGRRSGREIGQPHICTQCLFLPQNQAYPGG